MRSLSPTTLLLYIPAFLLLACSKGNSPASSAQASIQLVNTSVYNTSLKVVSGSTSLYATLQYPDSSGYLSLTLPSSGLAILNGSDTLATIDSNWIAGKDYTLFVTDSAGAGIANIAQVKDSLPALQSGYAGVRFLNFCGVAPNLDLYDSVSAEYLFTDRYYGETDAYSSAFQGLPAGTYNLQIRVPGELVYVADLPDFTLEQGKYYTFFARGTTTVQPNLQVAIGVLEHP
jgi:hypothetical protein